ncbi:MAG: tRNA (adenosine(37)-N6)-threonylcarbamoyltransferase complex transferase subunit TsaD, partial [Pseudomonadota bacterium]|nr:tRNA (adenosine(37)-N6)-threonylcarbamoyltransferase complex transferase subunit TsaD [Pseudomonadota bacterium]
ALGEAFDKTAKLLSLGYPGGPEVERRALDGNPRRFAFPRPLLGRSDCHFSFSGLKTAVRLAIGEAGPLGDDLIADTCASFEAAVSDVLADRVSNAMQRFRDAHHEIAEPVLVAAGGVAANARIRSTLRQLCGGKGFRLSLPPMALCTDNAAMIAWAGAERLVRGMTDGLDAAARARWPLDPAAEPAPGAGVKA